MPSKDYELIKKKMLEIAKSLRAELVWNVPGYCADEADYAACRIKDTIINEICDTIERVFNE